MKKEHPEDKMEQYNRFGPDDLSIVSDRQMFLASNAGKWTWQTKDGIYTARSCYEGKNRYREYPMYLVQYYEWDKANLRYKRPVKIKEIFPMSDLEADLYLAQVVGRPLQELIGKEVDESFPPSLNYSPIAKRITWAWAKEAGLYIAYIEKSKYALSPAITVSFKPYNLSKRWVTLFNKETHEDPAVYWQLFETIVKDIDVFLMVQNL